MAEQHGGRVVQNRTLMIISVSLGVAAVVLVNLYISAVKGEQRATIRLLRAAEDLDPSMVLKEEHLEAFDFPKMVKTALPDAVPADQSSNVKGERLDRTVRQGELLLWSYLYGRTRESLASKLLRGTCGVQIRVRGSWADIQKGDFVDLHGSVKLVRDGEPMDALVLRCVKVLRSDGDRLVIELRPDEVDKFRAIEGRLTQGGLRPSLRNPQDIDDYRRKDRFGGELAPLLEQIEERRKAASRR